MKLLKKLTVFTFILAMCISTTTYACPRENSDTNILPTSIESEPNFRYEFY